MIFDQTNVVPYPKPTEPAHLFANYAEDLRAAAVRKRDEADRYRRQAQEILDLAGQADERAALIERAVEDLRQGLVEPVVA